MAVVTREEQEAEAQRQEQQRQEEQQKQQQAQQQREREQREQKQQEPQEQRRQARSDREREAKAATERKSKMTRDQANAYERVSGKIQAAPTGIERIAGLVKDGMLTERELAEIDAALPELKGDAKDAAEQQAEDESAPPRPAEIGKPRPEMRALQARVEGKLQAARDKVKDYTGKAKAVQMNDKDSQEAEDFVDKINFLAFHQKRGG